MVGAPSGPRGFVIISDQPNALVWAFSELLVEPMNSEGLYEFYRHQAKAAAQRSKPQPAQTVPQPGSTEWFQMLAALNKQG